MTAGPPLPDARGGDHWVARTPARLLDALRLPHERLGVLAIDGHGGSGKSTLARRLVEVEAARGRTAVVVATDDVAWHHSMFDWSEALISGVLEPSSAGRAVRYRPPGWVARERPGAIEVPAETALLIVEGTGAGRLELSEWTDALIWVDADPAAARERGLARDLASGVNGATMAEAARFWDDWMATEIEFMAHHRPWDRADAIVQGTPSIALGDGEIAVAG